MADDEIKSRFEQLCYMALKIEGSLSVRVFGFEGLKIQSMKCLVSTSPERLATATRRPIANGGRGAIGEGRLKRVNRLKIRKKN